MNPAIGALYRRGPLIWNRELPPRIYLDHAAATPIRPEAARAMSNAVLGWANPSSPHREGRAARRALEDARGDIAGAYGWSGTTLLTSGASESLAIAFERAAVQRRFFTAVEHDAVYRAAGQRATAVPVEPSGLLSLDSLAAALGGKGRALVCVQWANSETGVRQPIAAIAEAVHAAGDLLLVDAAQMPAGADADVINCADIVALSAHKRGGPPGVGALLVRDLALLSPTGGQEFGYRPGTENVPAAIGYAAALAVPEPIERWTGMRSRLDDAIRRSDGQVIADGSPRHPAIGAYRMPGVAAAAQLIRFDLAGIAVSAGSACSSGSMKPSHVLAAMGWAEQAGREVVRVSFGRDTTDLEVDAFIAAWRRTVREARRDAA